jgi:hypothetical protein
MLERERKRKKLTARFSEKRQQILNELKDASSLEKIFELNEKLQKNRTLIDYFEKYK